MGIMFVVTGDAVNLTINGKMEVLHKSHKSYDKVIELLKSGNADVEELEKLMNPGKQIEEFGQGQLKIRDGVVVYTGAGDDIEVNVDNSLISRIQSMAADGFSVEPLVLFFENLMKNPSARAVQGLYRFLEKNNLPLTDDGHFLAYKKVRHDYGSIHKNPDGSRMDNSKGKSCEMLRNQVDDNHQNTCSTGLHFASFDYASNHYGSWDRDDRLMVVKVNPADVVAFPNDYNSSKGRTCRYEVIEEVPNNGMEYLLEDIQGVDTVEKIRGLMDEVRGIVQQNTPAPKEGETAIEFKLNDKLAHTLHKVKVQTIIDAVKAKYGIDADFSEGMEEVSIYRLVKFISTEVDLAEQE